MPFEEPRAVAACLGVAVQALRLQLTDEREREIVEPGADPAAAVRTVDDAHTSACSGSPANHRTHASAQPTRLPPIAATHIPSRPCSRTPSTHQQMCCGL